LLFVGAAVKLRAMKTCTANCITGCIIIR